MGCRHAKRIIARLTVVVPILLVVTDGWAIDGNSPNVIEGENGWKAFEVITENDSLAGLTLGQDYVPGAASASGTFAWTSGVRNHWDGLGAYKTIANNLRVLINHEGTDDAAITAVDVNIPNLRSWALNQATGTAWAGPGQVVTGVGNAFTTVDVTTGGSGRGLSTTPISRLCSGNVWQANTFGTGRGFTDQLYLTGEEDLTTTAAGGSIWVMDTATNVLYEAPDVSPVGGRWENTTIIDTGNTEQVALLLSSDASATSSDPDSARQLYLYVGTKDTTLGANFLERNGLVGGEIFQLDPDGAVSDLPATGSLNGTFATSTAEPLVEDKLEDVHVNPNDPTKVALADQTDGVYELEFTLQFNLDGTLDTGSSSFIASLLETATDSNDDGVSGTNLSSPDNLAWSGDGFIYVNEDGSGNDVWRLDPATSLVTLIADGHDTETSGVSDISSLVGFTAGSILLTNSYDGSNATNDNGQNGAFFMLVSPTATPVPEPGTLGLMMLGTSFLLFRRKRRHGRPNVPSFPFCNLPA